MRWHMLALGIAVMAAAGCQRTGSRPDAYQTVAEDPNRDTQTARRENAKALDLVEKNDLDAAEKALKAALTADNFFGPAHNNLGAVYLQQKRFYLAAWEFQYASKLMPYSAEPKGNLGLLYEAVGRLDDAEKCYDQALTFEPDNPELIGNLARTLVRAGRRDEKTQRVLRDLVLKETRPDWAKWARDRLALMRVEAPPVEIKPTPKSETPSVPPTPPPAGGNEKPAK